MVTAWQKLWKLFLKYKEVLLYLIFGGLTTLVNFIVYAVCARGFCLNTLQANASALIISILFAYITNKIFVFGSKTDSVKEIFREFFSFLACRLGTGALDMAFMYVSVDILGCTHERLVNGLFIAPAGRSEIGRDDVTGLV